MARRVEVLILYDDAQHEASARRFVWSACTKAGAEYSGPGDPVLVVIPDRAVETWLAYLAGESVDDGRFYPKLESARECESQVTALVAMCRACELRQPSPSSLDRACTDYATFCEAVGV